MYDLVHDVETVYMQVLAADSILKLLYPRHLCEGIYFSSSVRMFVRTSFRPVEFVSKFCVKVSQVVYISATTYHKAFIFGP